MKIWVCRVQAIVYAKAPSFGEILSFSFFTSSSSISIEACLSNWIIGGFQTMPILPTSTRTLPSLLLAPRRKLLPLASFCPSSSSSFFSSSSSSSFSRVQQQPVSRIIIQPPVSRLQPITRRLFPLSFTPKRHCSYRSRNNMCRRTEATSGSTNIAVDREVLPTNVKPVHYDLTLEPDFEKFTYDGSVFIEYVSSFI